MNKAKIKEFAIDARRQLMDSIAHKAFELGITQEGIAPIQEESGDSIVINGRTFNKEVISQRAELVKKIQDEGFNHVIEEAAYTWFNRFIAIRFMEVNRYLDHDLKILSSLAPTAAARKALPVLGLENKATKIADMVLKNQDEELNKQLLIAQCNALHKAMPFLFEKINDYTELLFPPGLLNQGSVIRRMVENIPEEDWGEVEIIGWMYQYYITEKKEEVVGMKKGTILKDDIPAATQLFTPDWIVRYMVQNSLGRFWFEMYPDSELIKEWEFFLKPDVEDFEKREPIPIEKIKFFDPCCGSGHILVYAFDLFYRMYEALGYPSPEIPALVCKNNLYGLDICRRAAQLSFISLVMKVRRYSPFIENIRFNVQEMVEPALLSNEAVDMVCHNENDWSQIDLIKNTFIHAKNFGSLINPPNIDYGKYLDRIDSLDIGSSFFVGELHEKLKPVLKQALMLRDKYEIVVTNPPYLNKYNSVLKKFIEKEYKDYKSDLFSAFIYRCNEMTEKDGFCGMMANMTWMFIKSYEPLRKYIVYNKSFVTLVHPEYHAFFSSAFVPIMTFVIKNSSDDKHGFFVDLNKFYGEEFQPIKLREAIENPKVSYRHTAKTSDFEAIPGCPIAYWASEKMRGIFMNNESLMNYGDSKQGLITGNTDKFLRYWYEVSKAKIGFDISIEEHSIILNYKWFPYNKGGDYRKWYGNNEYIVNWENNGFEIKNYYNDKGKLKSRPQNTHYFFRESLTWTQVTSSCFGTRYSKTGFLFDVGGPSFFSKSNNLLFFCAYLSSKLAYIFLNFINPTMNCNVGDVSKFPIIFPKDESTKDRIDNLAQQNITISKTDWDSFETSWDFQEHPLIRFKTDSGKIEDSFDAWEQFTDDQFRRLKANEEELNRIFIDIYGLQDELTPDVEDKDVTIRKADRDRDVRSFLSYTVGCMMGRYSPDVPGLTYAGGEFDPDKYKTFPVDEDAIIPILEDSWFHDDIVTLFIEFVKITFGETFHSENLNFIAEALGKTAKENPEQRIRKYFLNDFYNDHCRIYKKRPIYWLFTSGKNKAFNALVYLHRHDKSTLPRLRKDYLHELQAKIDRHIDALDREGNRKELSKYQKHQEELRKFEELLKHYSDMGIELDLDDGVVVNYAKFGDLLAKIK